MKKSFLIFLCALPWFVCSKSMETEWEKYEKAKENFEKIVAKPCVQEISVSLKEIAKYIDQIDNDKQLSELLKNIVIADKFLKKIEDKKRTEVKKKEEELDGNPAIGGLYFNEKKFVKEITLPLRLAEDEFEKIRDMRSLCWDLFFEIKKNDQKNFVGIIL